ncbi:UbiA prenyltransferase family protein [Polaribacter marinaquae]|uniref:Prenyltransferase n=1 Tax=Polaribacter marinaquae TaxID=1642819 RepID=A0ABZ2TR98_9FLAO
MKFLKIFLNFYLNASIHVALAVFSLVKITEQYFELSLHQNLSIFIFFSTITGYNSVKYAGVAKLHHRSLTNNLKVIQVFSFFCFLAMCFYAFKLQKVTLLFTLPFLLLTFLYAVPFLSGFDKTLREVSYLKIVVVAIVWAGFTVLIPCVEAGIQFNFKLFLVMFQRFLIVIILILPFDIRDVKYDAISLQTIPKKIGVEKTKRVGLTLMILALIVEYAINVNGISKNAFMIFFFLVIILLMRSKINQSKYYSSFWVESLPIIWWLFLLGFRNL